MTNDQSVHSGGSLTIVRIVEEYLAEKIVVYILGWSNFVKVGILSNI